jgi:hypothetical protein
MFLLPKYLKNGNIHYLGKHTNSINIQAKSNNINSTTISIEDIYAYDSMTSDSGHWDWQSGVTHTISANGTSIVSSDHHDNISDIELPSTFEIEVTETFSSIIDSYFLCLSTTGYSDNTITFYREHTNPYLSLAENYVSNAWNTRTRVSYSLPSELTYTIRYVNGELSLIYNNVVVVSRTLSAVPKYLNIHSDFNSYTLKDIKVRSLD